jgi:hypothetical protein
MLPARPLPSTRDSHASRINSPALALSAMYLPCTYPTVYLPTALPISASVSAHTRFAAHHNGTTK